MELPLSERSYSRSMKWKKREIIINKSIRKAIPRPSLAMTEASLRPKQIWWFVSNQSFAQAMHDKRSEGRRGVRPRINWNWRGLEQSRKLITFLVQVFEFEDVGLLDDLWTVVFFVEPNRQLLQMLVFDCGETTFNYKQCQVLDMRYNRENKIALLQLAQLAAQLYNSTIVQPTTAAKFHALAMWHAPKILHRLLFAKP